MCLLVLFLSGGVDSKRRRSRYVKNFFLSCKNVFCRFEGQPDYDELKYAALLQKIQY